MLRLTELKLPLDHAGDALRPAICQRLGIADDKLLGFTIFRRSYDARKRSAITLIYTLDIEVADEAGLLKNSVMTATSDRPRTPPTNMSPRPRPTCRAGRWSSAPAPAACWPG